MIHFLLICSSKIGKKMSIICSEDSKKDSVCFYKKNDFFIIFSTAYEISIYIDRKLYKGFFLTSENRFRIFSKYYHLFKEREKLENLIFLFDKIENFSITKNWIDVYRSMNRTCEFKFEILNKTISYLFDRKRKVSEIKLD